MLIKIGDGIRLVTVERSQLIVNQKTSCLNLECPLNPPILGDFEYILPHPSRSPLQGERRKDEAFYYLGAGGAKVE